MSILRRCLLAFGLIIVLGAVESALTVLQVSGLSTGVDAATELPLRELNGAWRASNAFHTAEAVLSGMLAGLRDQTQASMVSEFDAAVAPVETELAQAFPPGATIDREALTRLRQEIGQWREGALVLLGATPATAIPAPHKMDARSDAIRAGLQALIADAVKRAEAAHAAIRHAMSRTELLAVVFAAVSVCLGAAIAVPLAQSLARPLLQLQQRMRTMIDGDMDGPIAGEDRKDEVGQIARALGFMRERLAERHRAQNEAAMASLVEQQAVQAAVAAGATAEQSLIVASLKAGLDHLAQGDLTYQITTAFPTGYDALRLNFNATVTSLLELLGAITSSTGALRSGAEEITEAADHLSRRTEQQAANLEQTAAALDEVTATVRQTADGAQQARTIVANTQVVAEQSQSVMQDAITAMGMIKQSSDHISQIITVIDEIAFQTNLLALNAGVEAARAGDAGRGFAVVASEVRALAQRSAGAAKEIKTLISSSTQQVGNGVALVGKTGEALKQIAAQVSDVAGVVSAIAASAREQATGLAEVNTAVAEMDTSMQQNAALVEQSTTASHALSQATEDLSRLTQQFSLDPAAAHALAA